MIGQLRSYLGFNESNRSTVLGKRVRAESESREINPQEDSPDRTKRAKSVPSPRILQSLDQDVTGSNNHAVVDLDYDEVESLAEEVTTNQCDAAVQCDEVPNSAILLKLNRIELAQERLGELLTRKLDVNLLEYFIRPLSSRVRDIEETVAPRADRAWMMVESLHSQIRELRRYVKNYKGITDSTFGEYKKWTNDADTKLTDIYERLGESRFDFHYAIEGRFDSLEDEDCDRRVEDLEKKMNKFDTESRLRGKV